MGSPLHWMNDWSTPFALHVADASGAHVTDVDGHERADFFLGDAGAMFGHASPPVVEAVRVQMARGCTTMLPSTDAAWVGEELARRFGLPFWQSAMTASDANWDPSLDNHRQGDHWRCADVFFICLAGVNLHAAQ